MPGYLWEHYGDIASVLGLVISVVGFVVTILGVRAAQRSAEEARHAAREAVARIGSQATSLEIAIALQLIREVDVACREKNWVVAGFRGDDARHRLTHLLQNPAILGEENDTVLKAILDLGKLLNEVQKLREHADPRNLPARMTRRVGEILVDLGMIRGRIQSQDMEL